MIELRAAWINDTNQSHVYALARKLKLYLFNNSLQETVCYMTWTDLLQSLSMAVYLG
jgi:hypothetical protein